MTEQVKFLYSPLGKAFEKKKRKTIEDAAKKQTKALHTLNKDQQLK